MSRIWYWDIEDMHAKYGVHDWVKKTVEAEDKEKLKKFLEFRIKFLEEELNETKKAVEEGNAEEIVDGLIDLCVVAIGTLDAFEINQQLAWSNVHEANMNKVVGVKESRPNPLGLPDLVKPEGWVAPSHKTNHGLLGYLYGE
jgi:hypothetical protein